MIETIMFGLIAIYVLLPIMAVLPIFGIWKIIDLIKEFNRR